MKTLFEDCVSSLVPNSLLLLRIQIWSTKYVARGKLWDDYIHERLYGLRQLEKVLVEMGIEITAS
jgi:hypothetical protein